MKTLKKVFAVGLVAAFASAGFAAQAGAEHTEPRFTLEIDPSQGLPGQTINATVPDEHEDVCASSNLASQTVAAAFAAIAGDAFTSQEILEGIAASILSGAFAEGADASTALQTFLFLLLFIDPATEDPVSDPTSAFWNPQTGQGSIVAPGIDENPDSPRAGQVLARPSVYIVAAVCLGLKDLDEAVQAAVDALVDELGQLSNIGTLLADFGACLGQNPPPAGIPICVAAFAEDAEEDLAAIVPGIIGALLAAIIDDDPDVAWVAPFCLLGGNGEIETCDIEEVVTPAEPVVEAPVTFAG